MNVSIDKRVGTAEWWISQPILERLTAVVQRYAPCARQMERDAELEELYRLTEDAFSEALPAAPAYPAPDLHFLSSSSTHTLPRAAHRRAGLPRPPKPLHPRSFSRSAGTAWLALRRACISSRNMVEVARSALLAAAIVPKLQLPAAHDGQTGYDAVPAALRMDVGLQRRRRQAIDVHCFVRPLFSNGAF